MDDIWVWQRFVDSARQRGDAIALSHGDVSVTFSDLIAAAETLAGTLTKVSPGDRVLISGANSVAVPALVAGVWHRGAIPVLVHSDAPANHVIRAIAVTAPTAMFTDEATPDRTGNPWQQITWPPSSSMAPSSVAPPPPDTTRTGSDPASIVFTSGSSGPPKGVTQTSRTLIDGARRISELMAYTKQDSILCPIPFAFDYGWGQVMSLLLEGVPLILPEPRNAFGLCAALDRHRPTVLAGVPAVFGELTAGLAPIRDVARGSIRLITSTGSRMPAGTLSAVRALFPSAAISLNYGLTETYRSASLPPDRIDTHPGAAGLAIAGVDLVILRPDGTRADIGEDGEIVHRGAGTFAGYWNDPKRTAEVLRIVPDTGQPEVHTGDLGRIDENGLLYVHGRRDRQLKSMGVRVAPDEIEMLLLESQILQSVAISALPHDMIGDFIVACVVARDPDMPEKELLKALRGFARTRMSPHMQPRRYVVLPALPATPSAKIDYPGVARIVRQSA